MIFKKISPDIAPCPSRHSFTKEYRFTTPLKIRLLTEAQHILRDNDIDYDKELKAAYHTCIDNLMYNKNIFQLYKDPLMPLYTEATISDIFGGTIKKCRLIIGIDKTIKDGIDGINYSIPLDPRIYDEYIDSNPAHYYIQGIKSGGIDLCTVIITLPNAKDLDEEPQLERYVGTIRHELSHIFHTLVSKKMRCSSNYGYYYCVLISKSVNAKFPKIGMLQQFFDVNDTLSIKELLLLFAACCYYLDDSERMAWVQSFDSWDKSLKYIVEPKNLTDIEPYGVFYYLRGLLQKYSEYLKQIKDDPNVIDYVNTIFPGKNISTVIKKWVKSADITVKMMDQRYFKNLELKN